MTVSYRARISYLNYVQFADTLITATSEQPTLTATNVAKNSPYNDFWQTDATTVASLVLDFGSALPIDDLALDGLTLAATDTIRHRLSSADPTDGDIFDSGINACGVTPGYDFHSVSLDDTSSARYWQIDFSAPSRTAANFFRVGRAWAGPTIIPNITFDEGYADDWVDPSEVTVAKFSGKELITPLPSFRQVNFAFNSLTPAEARLLKELKRLAGQKSSVLFIPNPTSDVVNEEGLIGRLSKSDPIGYPSFPIRSWVGNVKQSL